MNGFFRNLIDSLKLQDDDESFEAYEQGEREKERKTSGSDRASSYSQPDRTASRQRNVQETSAHDDSQLRKVHSASNFGSSTYIENRNNNKTLHMERPEGSKVVPIKTTRSGLEVCVMKPRNLEDSQDICDVLLSNCVAIVNLEDNELALSQRIMDFISGAIYSVNGKLFQISELIFIVAPGAVDVSGDYNDILAQSGFDVPILNKGF